MSPRELIEAWARRQSHHGWRDAPAALAAEIVRTWSSTAERIAGGQHIEGDALELFRLVAAAIDVAMEAVELRELELGRRK